MKFTQFHSEYRFVIRYSSRSAWLLLIAGCCWRLGWSRYKRLAAAVADQSLSSARRWAPASASPRSWSPSPWPPPPPSRHTSNWGPRWLVRWSVVWWLCAVFQRSPYNIWEGYGSDGYLYDFVKRGGPDSAPGWEEAPALHLQQTQGAGDLLQHHK